MANQDHFPNSMSLLVLTAAQLLFAVIDISVLGYLQSAINNGQMGFLSTYRVVGIAVGFGMVTAFISIIFSVYFLVATRALESLYNRVAALSLTVVCLVFWIITFGLTINVFSLHGTTVPLPAWYSGAPEGSVYETLGGSIADSVYNSILAFAIIEWLLYIASTALLLRTRAPPAKLVVDEDDVPIDGSSSTA